MARWTQLLVKAGGFGVLVLSAGCAGNSLSNVLGGVLGQPAGTNTNNITAEVQSVNARNQTIQLRTQDGQTAYVYWDNRTQVVYGNQGYAVTALEPGDVVNMRIQ